MKARKVAFPARAAVTLAYEQHLLSQVFPAALPVEDFFEGMVELLDDDLKRRGLEGVALPPGSYDLHKVNGVRLDVTRSLDELGVQDGDTLVLVPASDGESFQPQYEALSSALAAAGRRLGKIEPLFAPVTALTAARTAIAILAMAVTVIVALTWRARTWTDTLMPAAVCGVMGVLLAVGAAVCWWGWRERTDLVSGFGWLTTVTVASAAAVAPPGVLGAAHLLIGITVLALGAIAISVLTRTQTAVVTALVCLFAVLGAVAATRSIHPVSARVIGLWLLGLLPLLVKAIPVPALWIAKVRPPRFGSITGRDIFSRQDGMPLDTVSPVGEDDEEDALTDITARGAHVEASTRLTNAVQLGCCAAAAAVLPLAVWVVLVPGQQRQWAAVLLAGLVAGYFVMEARSYTAKYQGVALVCGASLAVCSGVLKYALSAPGNSAAGLLWPTLVVALFAAAALAAALLVPATEFIPFIRLAVEWLAVLVIVIVLPLAAWLGGLFAWVRNW